MFYPHTILMFLMCVFVVSAAAIGKMRPKNWILIHKTLAILGVLCGLAGAGLMFYGKAANGWPHFKTLHAIGGGIAALLLIITPLLGFLATKGKDSLRPAHRIFGRITAILALLVLITGIDKLYDHLKK